MHKIVALAAVAAAFVASSAMASVDPVPGVFNTGVGADGTTVLNPGEVDTHYTVATGPGTSTQATVTGAYPGAWAATSGSNWIGDFNANPGIFDFVTNFSLSGFNSSTAVLNGRFAADNSATVWLNGTQIAAGTGFNALTSFTANAGFNAGLNTLVFEVTNDCCGQNPMGLNVNGLSLTAVKVSAQGAVPEPATWAMMLIGFGAIGVAARRNRNTVALA